MVMLIAFVQASFACSLVAGAEDPTSETVERALGIFLLAMIVAVAHGALFIYRKGRNGWIFWICFALSLIIIPVSLFIMAMKAGTACGNGSMEIAFFNFAFQIAAFAAQLISWKYGDRSSGLNGLGLR